MDGVTILNTYVENIPTTGNFVVILIFSIIMAVLSLVVAFVISDGFGEFNGAALVFVIIAIFGTVSTILTINELTTSPKEPQTLYEATISDEVSFKDFTSKYEIIEQRGDIYVVKEREQNDGQRTVD